MTTTPKTERDGRGKTPAPISFYVTGGTVPTGASSYVARDADTDLLAGLLKGEFCYVLNTRQMGKSSLMVRTAAKIREAGHRVAVLDLTAIGQNLSPEQWYDGLLVSLGEQTDLEEELEDFWQDHANLGPMQRFFEAIGRVSLPALLPGQQLVVFVDEVDATRSLPFPADEFFAGVRQCHNRRIQEPGFERLAFCLLGVATPADLIQDTRLSPFNIGRRICLADFTPAEAAPLAAGLPGGKAALDRVLYWTGGHPYLTQKLCRVAAEQDARTPSDVDALCERLFLTRQARESDDNLAFVRNRLLRSEADTSSLLDLYLQVRAGRRVPDDESNPLCALLRLAGIVRTDEAGRLRVRNRVYERVFDATWVRASLPDAELRRQRVAFRRGLLRAGAVGGAVVAAMGALAFRAVQSEAVARTEKANTEREREAADLARRSAEAAAERARRSAAAARHERDRALEAEKRASASEQQAQASLELANQAQSAAARAAEGERSQKAVAQMQAANARRAGAVSQQLLYVANLNLMQAAWERGDARRVGALLKETGQSPYRGWEWRFWQRMRHLELTSLPLPGSAAPVRGMAFSPDGKRLFTAGDDGRVRLWPVSEGTATAFQAPLPLQGHAGTVSALALSADGRTLVTGGADHTVRLWDGVTGKSRKTLLTGLPGRVLCLALSPDGKRLAVGVEQARGRVYDVGSGQAVLDLPEAGGPVYRVAFSPDGRRLAAAGYDNVARVWDARTGSALLRLEGHKDRLSGLGVSPDGRYIATASSDGTARLWDAATGESLAVLRGHTNDVYGPVFSPDSRRVATVSSDNSARVWDTRTGREEMVLRGHEAGLMAVAFSPDGGRLATAGFDRTIRVWDAVADRDSVVAAGYNGKLLGATFSPDGRRFATACEDGTARIRDTVTGKEIVALGDRSGPVGSVSFSPEGKRLALGTVSGEVQVWDIPSRRRLVTLKGFRTPVWDARFSPDGRSVAGAGSGDDVVRVWDAATGKASHTLPGHRDGFGTLAFSPDGKRIATTTARTLLLWDARTGRRLSARNASVDCANWVAFSPKGDRIVTGGADGVAALWDSSSLRPLHLLRGHAGGVNGAGFSPEGNRIATASLDNTARVWDTGTGRELLTLRGHSGRVNAALFSPDGQRLLTVGHDGAARLWLTDAVAGGVAFAQNAARQERERLRREIADLMRTQNWTEATTALTLLLEETPDDNDLRRQRGEAYARAGRFDLATTDFAAISRETRAPEDVEGYARALLGAGDFAGYRTLSATRLRRLPTLRTRLAEPGRTGGGGGNGGNGRGAGGSGSGPGRGLEETRRAADEMQRIVYDWALVPSDDPRAAAVAAPTFGAARGAALAQRFRDTKRITTAGVAAYRAGRYVEAIRLLEDSERIKSDPVNSLFLAMAYAKQGDAVKSRACLDRAGEAGTTTDWRERVVREVLTREATEEMASATPKPSLETHPPVPGNEEP